MNNISFSHHIDVPNNTSFIRGDYHIRRDLACPADIDEISPYMKELLTTDIAKQMLEDIFSESDLTDADLAWILSTTLNHDMVERNRKKLDLVKKIPYDQLKDILMAYGALTKLGMFGDK